MDKQKNLNELPERQQPSNERIYNEIGEKEEKHQQIDASRMGEKQWHNPNNRNDQEKPNIYQLGEKHKN